MKPDTNPVIQLANANQRKAADPFTSVWVAASAGSGKTKVLTDRILRLLLSGAAPSKILALTFTNAAAAEMANRLSGELAEWATKPGPDLDAALTKLLGRSPQDEERHRAARLFADVLESPGGMRIQTMHAFCQSLLGRFPIEAGVPPNFELLDELGTKTLLERARDTVLAEGFEKPDSDIATHLRILSRNIAEDAFISLITKLLSERGRLSALFAKFGGVSGWVTEIYKQLGLSPTDTTKLLEDWFCDSQNYDQQDLRTLTAACELSDKATDQKAATEFASWLSAEPPLKCVNIDAYLSVWLTGKLELRKSPMTKAVKDPHADIIEAEQTRVLRFVDQRNRIRLAEGNAALMQLLAKMLEQFVVLKAANAKLDYDDLILKARHLLEASETSAQWVLHKLDEGLSHILVDEAQDTNPDQWQVILLLAREFFSDQGAGTDNRTIFVVGDRKQSIYGFQRADPKVFDAMQKQIEAMVRASDRQWATVDLDISFRSTAAVLSLTDKTLERQDTRKGLVQPERDEWREHIAKRALDKGQVVLWPLVRKEDEEALKPEIRLANQIAERIKLWTTHGEEAQSEVRPGDILILLQSRQPLAKLLVRALQLAGVPVAGLDRMELTSQLVVQDLIVLGDFALFPDGDLSCAAILRSPFCNLSEQDLFDAAADRGKKSLWQNVKDLAETRADFQPTRDFLTKALNRAERTPAFEFFASMVSSYGKRAPMRARLGDQIDDPIQEFLNRAIAYESEGPSSIQGFLNWLRKSDLEIKRDAEAASKSGLGEVRIMTVHGAKGLQAPVVILPQTTKVQQRKFNDKPLWHVTDDPQNVDTCWWLPNNQMQGETHLKTMADLDMANEDEERRRLLYVALTRAQDSMHLMGYTSAKDLDPATWYATVEQGFGALNPEDTTAADGSAVRIFKTGEKEPEQEILEIEDVEVQELDDAFLERPAPEEPTPPSPLIPSRLDEDEAMDDIVFAPSLGKSASGHTRRFQRGLVTHALLQHLPNVDPDKRETIAEQFVESQRPVLDENIQADILSEVFQVMEHPQAALLFGPDSQAEVPLVGLVDKRMVSARVDRLVVLPDRVLIIDFKSNRPPPPVPEQVSKSYIRQMDLYTSVLKLIYPNHDIQRFLLWTDGCHLMRV